MEINDLSFHDPEEMRIVTIARSGVYIPEAITKKLLRGGSFVEPVFDPKNQAIKLKVFSTKKRGRSKLNLEAGTSVRIYNRAANMGMKVGKYMEIEDGIYQHIENI